MLKREKNEKEVEEDWMTNEVAKKKGKGKWRAIEKRDWTVNAAIYSFEEARDALTSAKEGWIQFFENESNL